MALDMIRHKEPECIFPHLAAKSSLLSLQCLENLRSCIFLGGERASQRAF